MIGARKLGGSAIPLAEAGLVWGRESSCRLAMDDRRRRVVKGSWLGIDVGSARGKACSFCLIESGGAGDLTVAFEVGPARAPYPGTNSRDALLSTHLRRPTYLKKEVEAAIHQVLDRSELVTRWLERGRARRSAVAIDAPVAFAVDGVSRLTEQRSTDTFKTPDRATFERQLGAKGDPFLRVNGFWKCVGLAVYCHLAERLDPRLAGAALEAIAARTCARDRTSRRLRETFPSDVYKRANGVAGILSSESRGVLEALVASEWRRAGQAEGRPGAQTLKRLVAIRDLLRLELAAPADRLREMRKRPGRTGDLWDAFTCAFTGCCEDHGAGELHGWSADRAEQRRLRREGAILTVTTKATHAPP